MGVCLDKKITDNLKSSLTIYAVADLLARSGMEATDFFLTAGEALVCGINKHKLFKAYKLELFYCSDSRGDVYNVIRETTFFVRCKQDGDILDSEPENEVKYWKPFEKESCFVEFNGSNLCNELSNKVLVSPHSRVFDVFIEMGCNIFNASDCMVYVAGDKFFYYDHILRSYLRGSDLDKECFRVYGYEKNMGFSNVLEFVRDYDAQVSVRCTMDFNGEVVILSDKGKPLAFLNNENELNLTKEGLNSEEQRTVDMFKRSKLSFRCIKRAFMVCFEDGLCIWLNDSRAVLRTLKKPIPNIRGSRLPEFKPYVKKRLS